MNIRQDIFSLLGIEDNKGAEQKIKAVWVGFIRNGVDNDCNQTFEIEAYLPKGYSTDDLSDFLKKVNMDYDADELKHLHGSIWTNTGKYYSINLDGRAKNWKDYNVRPLPHFLERKQ